MSRQPMPTFLYSCITCVALAGCGGIEYEAAPPVDVSKAAPPADQRNRPPVIDTKTTATGVAAGRAAQLAIGVSDSDGDRVTLLVRQLGGSVPLANLTVDTQGIRFDAPGVKAATRIALVLQATDATGLTSHAQIAVTVSPVSRSGKLFTVLGSPEANGLHWVITGDGFTAAQQPELLQSALAMARHFANAPELA